MEILLWLVPPIVVTGVAMVWVSWIGRDGRGEVDPEVALQRMAAALTSDRQQPARQAPPRPTDRSTGIAVRPTRAVEHDRQRRAS